MSLLEYINNSLSDEKDATDEYATMRDEVEANTSLTDEEKGLISGILFKIETDEKTHKVLLSIIKEVLENKKNGEEDKKE